MSSKTVEKLTEIGSIDIDRSRSLKLKVILYQQVTQEVRFVQVQTFDIEGHFPNQVAPLSLKATRQLRRLLGQAENKMRKLIEKMAKERRKANVKP